jgi:hypothetical protein
MAAPDHDASFIIIPPYFHGATSFARVTGNISHLPNIYLG